MYSSHQKTNYPLCNERFLLLLQGLIYKAQFFLFSWTSRTYLFSLLDRNYEAGVRLYLDWKSLAGFHSHAKFMWRIRLSIDFHAYNQTVSLPLDRLSFFWRLLLRLLLLLDLQGLRSFFILFHFEFTLRSDNITIYTV